MKRLAFAALVATLFTWVGCGGTSLRRPLVTDALPLGTPRDEVRMWHAKNGWCESPRPVPWSQDLLMFQPCTGRDRHGHVIVVRFREDGRLYAAWVYARVPRAEGSTPIELDMPERAGAVTAEPEWTSEPESEQAVASLAVELEARHGRGEEVAPRVRSWKTDREWILMYVQGTWVVEAHWPRPSGRP